MTDTIGTTDLIKTQTITTNPTAFRNSTGYWKLKFTAVKSTTTQFDMKIDLAKFSPELTNYALDLEEQWTNVNATNPRQDLCIKTGALGSESLKVDVRTGSSWTTIINSLQPNTWNNVSMYSYISSPTLTIRFKGSNDLSDPVQDNWNIDAVLLKPQPDIGLILSMQDQPAVVEYATERYYAMVGTKSGIYNSGKADSSCSCASSSCEPNHKRRKSGSALPDRRLGIRIQNSTRPNE